MQCPKCDSSMESVGAAYDQQVDRCGNCRGLFVSLDALKSLRRELFFWPRSKTEKKLDTGDPDIGRKYDAVIDINCPTCGIRMKHVTVEEQTHIKLEQCGDCKGIFFDAGELTDMKYKTFADWVRDRFARVQATDGNLDWPERLN